MWDLKDKNIDIDIDRDITWKILDRAQPYNPITDVCNLCTLEKYYLIFKPETSSLNLNEEINSYCLHKDPLLLEVRRHKPGDFMAGYRIARAFLSGWTYVRVTLLSGQFCPPLEKFVE